MDAHWHFDLFWCDYSGRTDSVLVELALYSLFHSYFSLSSIVWIWRFLNIIKKKVRVIWCYLVLSRVILWIFLYFRGAVRMNLRERDYRIRISTLILIIKMFIHIHIILLTFWFLLILHRLFLKFSSSLDLFIPYQHVSISAIFSSLFFFILNIIHLRSMCTYLLPQ